MPTTGWIPSVVNLKHAGANTDSKIDTLEGGDYSVIDPVEGVSLSLSLSLMCACAHAL